MMKVRIGALTVSIGQRHPVPSLAAKAGRPSIQRDLLPWFEKMHPLVEGELSVRRAAEQIARLHMHAIPCGTGDKRRTLASTIDLLRKGYRRWREAEQGMGAEAADQASAPLGNLAYWDEIRA